MATKKVKRYNGAEDGSSVTADELEAANATEDPIAALNKAKRWTDTEDAPAAKAAPVKAKVVTKEELAKSGLSLRDYLNKQQGLTRQGGSGRGTRGGPTADELESYASSKKASRQSEYEKANAAAATPAGKAARAKKIEAQALEESHPEDLVMGIAKAPVKAALSAGRALATKGADEAIYLGKTAARRIEPEAERLASAASKRISGKDTKRVTNNPTRKISGPEVASEGRESGTNPMSWMSGPKNARDFKKGGKIKPAAFAGGGSVSRRGDGIATKGKTRGRMC
jgi:hypothetical protein